MSSPRLAFVIATKDRPLEIGRLLRNLREQSRRPDLVVIVDSGTPPLSPALLGEGGFGLVYVRCLPPSSARQRNLGLASVGPGFDLVGFLDDDAVFEPGAVAAMLDFWSSAGPDVGGAGFNLLNHPPLDFGGLKRTPFAERLGLYRRKPGAVAPSGFQTLIGTVPETTDVEWLPTTAVVWRREVFERHRFDEWFRGYSYLEDLDFSYRVGLEKRLVIVAPALYLHLQASGGRGNDFEFGRGEVGARFHFVDKHPGLSPLACWAALGLRFGLSLAGMVRDARPRFGLRALGNLVGFAGRIAGC
ncbi:MAG: glycosyltransferase family 2 protein [Candidatus Aminicenantes bacterium]|nr:glycosyltransferase family 2 protein [Candidatus Aminicenantes bacterium]